MIGASLAASNCCRADWWAYRWPLTQVWSCAASFRFAQAWSGSGAGVEAGGWEGVTGTTAASPRRLGHAVRKRILQSTSSISYWVEWVSAVEGRAKLRSKLRNPAKLRVSSSIIGNFVRSHRGATLSFSTLRCRNGSTKLVSKPCLQGKFTGKGLHLAPSLDKMPQLRQRK